MSLTELIGDGGGRRLVIVDYLVSTGATIEVAELSQRATRDVTVATVHALLTPIDELLLGCRALPPPEPVEPAPAWTRP